MSTKKEDVFKEDYIDDSDKLMKSQDFKKSENHYDSDIVDPYSENFLDIDDPLSQEFKIETLDNKEVEKPTKKGLFKRSKKDEREELNNNIENIDLDYENFTLEGLQDDSLSIEELEQRERVRQRKELAKAEIAKKKADRLAFIESFKSVGTLIQFAIYSGISTVYIWWLSGVLIPSIIVSFIGAFWLTYWFYYRKNKLEVEESEFKDLTNIATQINFNMQNGKNVADTLNYIKDDYEGRVGADLDYTYSKLMAEGVLITDNFDKYGFTSFDIFLRNLQIAYHDGIDAKKLFKFPLSNINYEAIERDDLLNKNKASKKQELMTWAVGVFIPVSLRLFAKDVFMAYLGYPMVAFIGAIIVYFVLLKILTSLQKVALDVSVSL